MKRLALIVLLSIALSATAQEELFTIDAETIEAVQDWASENIDEDTLKALGVRDQEQVKTFFDELLKKFQSEYVIDMAQVRELAKVVLPTLEANEETQPYAAWLKSRLDYFEIAEELKATIRPPKTETNKPAPKLESPRAEVERELWIRKVSKRPVPPQAAAYVKRLKPIFSKRNVPAELVWIAEVESSFDPRAKSPAGAAGLFQLMPATAKQYGLRTWPIDQRYRPDESADAAARHLAYLYRKFGDWRLAAAAYNAGEGTVQRALDRRRAKTFDAIAPVLPAETQMYVPKLEAILQKREGVQLATLRLAR